MATRPTSNAPGAAGRIGGRSHRQVTDARKARTMHTVNVIAAERVERAALADLHAAASSTSATLLGLRLETIDGALVSIAASAPTILANRTIGLGVEHAARPGTVADVVGLYTAASVDRYLVHQDPHAHPGELAEWLEAAGLTPFRRAWAKFVRGTHLPPHSDSDLEVRRIGPEHAEQFARIAARGFDLDPSWCPVLAGLVDRPGWHVYLSFDHEQPAGCAALRVLDGVAWFDWAATAPEFRRRGSQSALLVRRIADAISLGCRLMVTTTGEAVPGDPQHSYRNILRAGFRLSHSRANWTPGHHHLPG